MKETPIPIQSLNEREQAIADALTEYDLSTIDAELKKNSNRHWRKVAMVVAKTYYNLESIYPGLPVDF